MNKILRETIKNEILNEIISDNEFIDNIKISVADILHPDISQVIKRASRTAYLKDINVNELEISNMKVIDSTTKGDFIWLSVTFRLK